MLEAKLDGEAKEFALDELAMGTPVVMVHKELVKRGFDITYDCVYSIYRRMDIEEIRQRRQAYKDRIPISNKEVRLKRLESEYKRADDPRDRLRVLRQAAEEMGDISSGSKVQVSQSLGKDSPEAWWQELARERRELSQEKSKS